MWLFIFTSFMFFAALSSGFIVYSGGKGHGLDVILPRAFMYSTAVILSSSLTLYIASNAAKHLQFARQRLFLWLTLFLGIAFFAIQVYGWYVLTYKMGVYFSNPNASRIVHLRIQRYAPDTYHSRVIDFGKCDHSSLTVTSRR